MIPGKGLIAEFREFISRDSVNVMDMAVGVVVGGSFGSIVTSLVNDVVSPIIGMICGGLDFSELSITVGDSRLMVGRFISSIINFLLISLVIFAVMKAANKARELVTGPKEEVKAVPTTKICPYCKSEIPIDATRCRYCTSEVE